MPQTFRHSSQDKVSAMESALVKYATHGPVIHEEGLENNKYWYRKILLCVFTNQANNLLGIH